MHGLLLFFNFKLAFCDALDSFFNFSGIFVDLS